MQTEKQQYSANKAFTPNLKQTTPSADDLSTEQTQQLETIKSLVLSCKHCGEESNYTPMYGKYGYYIKCNQCEKNTSMKR